MSIVVVRATIPIEMICRRPFFERSFLVSSHFSTTTTGIHGSMFQMKRRKHFDQRQTPAQLQQRGISGGSTGLRHGPTTKHLNTTSSPLPPPSIIYQDNHLLVLYKPPGWHSIPNTSTSTSTTTATSSTCTTTARIDTKCLLSYCQQHKYGGGSQQNYIKPIHRIDQPCSGILLYSKTTKAAQRIQKCFMDISTSTSTSYGHITNHDSTTSTPKIQIQKVYYVMVRIDSTNNKILYNTGTTRNNTVGEWYTLHGKIIPSSSSFRNTKQQQHHHHHHHQNKGWSVRMQPIYNIRNRDNDSSTNMNQQQQHKEKHCSLQYRFVTTYKNSNSDSSNLHLLQIITHQGARHMIRSLLSCHDIYVVGDVRYTPNTVSTSILPVALPDQSVALHAYSIQLLKSIVMKTKPLKRQLKQDNNNNTMSMKTTCDNDNGEEYKEEEYDADANVKSCNNHQDRNNCDNTKHDFDKYFMFKAPIPKLWNTYFHCTQTMIDQWEQQYPL